MFIGYLCTTLSLAETPTSSPMQPQINMTVENRRGSNPFSSPPRKNETFSKSSPPRANNATFDQLQNQDQGLNNTYNFESPPKVPSNEKQSPVNLHVPYIHDNPNRTFDIPVQNQSTANATFTCGENSIDNSNCNESVNLRKITYAIAPGNSSITRTNNSVSSEHANANINNFVSNNCDISDSARNCNKQSGHPNGSKDYSVQKLSRDSSQGAQRKVS